MWKAPTTEAPADVSTEGGGAIAGPFSETAPATDQDPRTGRVLPGNQLARKYPKAPDQDAPAVAQLLAERREQHIKDRGGRAALTEAQVRTITRYTLLELFAESWEAFFLRAGIVTRQGRVRSGFTSGYLATLTQLMRLGQIIGLDRVERQSTLTARQWLEATRAEHDAPASTEEHDS